MLFDKFSNNGNKYMMTLRFNAVCNSYDVNIKSDDYCSSINSYGQLDETHSYPSYSEACSKFRSVFVWNHGQQPSLPSLYDFVHSNRVVPQPMVGKML